MNLNNPYIYLFNKSFQGLNKDDCMIKLDTSKADILSLDAGEVFVGGRYNSLIPLMQQLFEGSKYIILQFLMC